MSTLRQFLLLPVCLTAALAQAQAPLPSAVSAALARAEVPASAFAVWVAPLNHGSMEAAVLDNFADRAISPASTMKLVTTMVALDELGPTYRWHTALLSDATQKDGTLQGDLYLRGGGDPGLSWDKLALMLRNLRAQGVKKIAGDIVLDRSFFKPARADVDVPPFDEYPDAYYNVIPDALLIHSNLVSFTLEASANHLSVQTLPPLYQVNVVNHLELQNKSCAAWEAGWNPPTVEAGHGKSWNIVLSGNFPRHCKVSTDLNTLDRNLYIERLVLALWREMGGTWSGEVREGLTPAGAKLLVERQSDTLADTIRVINKRSDNVMARMLYLTLGAESTGGIGASGGGADAQDTRQAAKARILAWLARHGIATEGLVMENGSGLSRTERITPHQLAGVLSIAARSNWFPEFASSLPIAAVDGTMRRHLKGTGAEGRARIKTGTLRDTTAVAGYVRDSRNNDWIVVGAINDDKAAKSRAALDELLLWVADGAVQEAPPAP